MTSPELHFHNWEITLRGDKERKRQKGKIEWEAYCRHLDMGRLRRNSPPIGGETEKMILENQVKDLKVVVFRKGKT